MVNLPETFFLICFRTASTLRCRGEDHLPFWEIGAKACADASTARKAKSCLNMLTVYLIFIVIVSIGINKQTTTTTTTEMDTVPPTWWVLTDSQSFP